MTVSTEEPLFSSAHAALVFAFNFSGQGYDRPVMSRMATPAIGSGKGLAGLDGAAQTGFIRAEVAAIGKLHEAILIARIAPRSTPCSCRSACCSGQRPNVEWHVAVSVLADRSRTSALSGCTSDGRIRRGLVMMYFGGVRMTVAGLAEDSEQARRTVAAHLGRVRRWLKDEEAKAWDEIDWRLSVAGMTPNGDVSGLPHNQGGSDE